MINRALLLLTPLLLLPETFGAQPKTSKKPLELIVDIVSQSYCAVNEDVSSLELKLRLRFRNVGNQKLILYKGHDLFYQTRIRSAPGNPSGPYEVWVVNSRYFDQEVEAIDQASALSIDQKVRRVFIPSSSSLCPFAGGLPIPER